MVRNVQEARQAQPQLQPQARHGMVWRGVRLASLLQQAMSSSTTNNTCGSPSNGLSDECLPSIDALLLFGAGGGGPAGPRALGPADRRPPQADAQQRLAGWQDQLLPQLLQSGTGVGPGAGAAHHERRTQGSFHLDDLFQ
jgi:hypothetical protein